MIRRAISRSENFSASSLKSGFFIEKFEIVVNLENSFGNTHVIVTVFCEFLVFHRIMLIFDGFLSQVHGVDLLDQLFKSLALSIGVADIMVADAFDNVVPVLFAPSFECSSSDLIEDLPSSRFEEVVPVAELE
jgi:hypothetical protein